MKLSLLVRKWHKWLALVVGVQLLLWTFSGLYMSAVPIEVIKSEHKFKEKPQHVLSSGLNFFPVADVISKYESENSVVGLEITSVLDKPTYIVRMADSSKHLVDAVSGELISPLTRDSAIEIAEGHFKGDASKATAELMSKKVSEYRGKYPVWQVNFNNLEQTTFYVSPNTGQLTAKRGILWRVYDFLWMLHIMDYRNRTDFNNWLLVLAAILGLAVSVSGLILIRFSFRKRDFKFIKRGN